MSKHITDHPQTAADRPDRMFEAAHRVDDDSRHPASKALHRRETTKSDQRAAQYVRIDRGRSA